MRSERASAPRSLSALRITRFAGEIAAGADVTESGIDHHHDPAFIGLREQDETLRDTRPRHAWNDAGDDPAATDPSGVYHFGARGSRGERAVRHGETHGGEHPCRKHRGFRERHRCGVASGDAQYRGEIGKRAARAAHFFGRADAGELRLFERPPQRRRPAITLCRFEDPMIYVVVHEPGRRLGKHRADFVRRIHLSGPSSRRAMSVRSTCVVPPRIVEIGAQTIVSAR